MRRKNIAVVLAGGVGSRFGSPEPKQFAVAAGKTILEHSVMAFERHPQIDGIAIVIHPDYRHRVAEMLRTNGWKKIEHVLDGGQERYHSSVAAIEAYRGQDVNLLFHDAARPLVTAEIIDNVAKALETHRAVGVGVPSTDTVWQVETGTMRLSSVPDRSSLYHAQTPQAFRLDVIVQAYENALRDPDFHATDDCGVVVRYLPGEPVFIVSGSTENNKVTHPEDLAAAERLLRRRENSK